jgi:hypothetical protein
MPRSKPPYPGAFRQRIVELHMSGHTPAELIDQGRAVSRKRMARPMRANDATGAGRGGV